MTTRGDWLEYTRERAPEGVSQDVYEVIRRWLETHEVAEVDLEPMEGYYAIHINGAPEPVPGVFLPKSLERDPQAVRDLLDAALAVYEQEIAAH